MEHISKQAIEELIHSGTSPAVTLYVPMHTTASPPHVTENQVRLKNLVHKAAETLKANHTDEPLAQTLCSKLEELLDDTAFWESQTPGLLICANPAMLRMFHLPIDTEEYVSVDTQFHLAPVLALMNDQQEYYVLAIAQHDPKLFVGNMYGLQPSSITLPANMQQALGIDENNQKSENQGSATGSSLNTGWFNGRGGSKNPQEEDRMRFWRMLDKIILDSATSAHPIVLVGTDAEVAEYRGISKHPKLLAGSISGNYHDLTLQDMFAKSYTIVQSEILEPARQAAIEEYHRLLGANPSRVTEDKIDMAEAAEQGRIDKLLAAMVRHTTDTIRDRADTVKRISFPEPGISKTLNHLAAKVWSASGKIISLHPHELQSGAPMAARLRY